MAVSLETKIPLLDKDIIEYAFSLNQSERCYNGELKEILKTAYRGRIPDNLLYRRKWGLESRKVSSDMIKIHKPN